MNFFRETFNEDSWIFYLVEDDDNVITDENLAAEVAFDKKEVYFRKSNLSLALVTHEIWHLYFSYCYLGETNDMTLADIEEVSAEMFSDKGERMIERAKIILDKLEQLKLEAELQESDDYVPST